jgi:hypothetical protein
MMIRNLTERVPVPFSLFQKEIVLIVPIVLPTTVLLS